MDREFEGKKLLILGGNPETTPLVEIANGMGVKTIVTSGRDPPIRRKKPRGRHMTLTEWMLTA